MELELRRFSVTLKRLLGGVGFDLLSSIVPCLPPPEDDMELHVEVRV